MSTDNRLGDEGYTKDAARRRIPRDSPHLFLLGALDELNACLGWCLSACEDPLREVGDALRPIQEELLAVGATISARAAGIEPGATLPSTAVRRLEDQIAAISSRVGPLTSFIVPGGCEAACRLHMARTVCRRAERRLIAWSREAGAVPQLAAYLNRLSDLMFALARQANHTSGRAEIAWHPTRGG